MKMYVYETGRMELWGYKRDEEGYIISQEYQAEVHEVEGDYPHVYGAAERRSRELSEQTGRSFTFNAVDPRGFKTVTPNKSGAMPSWWNDTGRGRHSYINISDKD